MLHSNILGLHLVLLLYSLHQLELEADLLMGHFYGKITSVLQELEVLDILLQEPSVSTPWEIQKLTATTGWHTAM